MIEYARNVAGMEGAEAEGADAPLHRRGLRPAGDGGVARQHPAGAGAGQAGLHPDGGEIHLGQRGYRKQNVGDYAHQSHGQCQQGGAHGARNEGGGNVHGQANAAGAS